MQPIKIGLPLSRGGGGPTIFMRRLHEEIKKERLSNTTYFFDPFADILVCANAIRNPWRKPYVLRLDGIAFDEALGTKEIDRRNRPIFDGIDSAAGLIFQANFSKSLISAHYSFPEKPYAIIPNGVDLQKFTPNGPNLRSQLGLTPNDLVFLTSAKWRSHKRLDATLAAFDQFCSSFGGNAHLLVLGELDIVPTSISTNVKLIGHIEPTELPLWYRSANICLFFSWLDNCPNTVVEALASGLPVLVTNQGGTRELIELTKGGIVVEADSKFPLTRVELYKPPTPNPSLLLQGMKDIVDRREQIATNIKRDLIGIDTIARHYVNFTQKVLGTT